jgi:hypothetical protein
VSDQELHHIAMNYVGKLLEKEGFEFLAVNSQLKKHPQFVCVDSKNSLHFVLVQFATYPDNPQDYDPIWMEVVKKHGLKKNAKIKFAGVGIANALNINNPIVKHEDYHIFFEGFQDIV